MTTRRIRSAHSGACKTSPQRIHHIGAAQATKKGNHIPSRKNLIVLCVHLLLFKASSAVASTVGGGIGVGIAELALKSKRCTQSTIRFLRLGMWLPFFVAWAAPI